MTLVLRYIARSDRGLVRSNNEDSVYAGARLLALADGMGGHAAGEVASQLVIEALRPLDNDEPGGDLLSALERATADGNNAIAEQVAKQPELDGMGTTLTAILFAGSRIGLCHVGDSRGYLYRDGQLTQITRDDTFVQSLVDEGRITAEQAHTHPQRSLIMRALTGQEVEPTLIMREARAGDRYLLCSDGLSDVVSDETLSDTLGSLSDHKVCADRLIELALRSGGPDNVTVVVADVVDTEFGDSTPIVGGAAGDDDSAGYVPNPATAAGRAAALRAPAPKPARPTITAEPTPEKKTSWRWPLAIIAVLAIIGLLVTTFFVVRSKAMASTFVTAVDGNVEIFSGTPDSLLFFTVQSPKERACVDDPNAETPQVSFQAVDSSEPCNPMRVADLTGIGRNAVTSQSIKNDSLETAHERVRTLAFLPKCPEPAPVPEPKPNDRRTESTKPGEPKPTEAPKPGEPKSNEPTTAVPSPAPTTDAQGQPTCRGAA
ncbi:protein phosphatase 2C domain-containing protein [Gordonia sp. (in: high G+C Gram-positive bacteria)]|uniref:protein phosphatase 2C domain-containing protein n=1 Tax=Gordonia sp. (in: high G+C Gram-positive bacteria) TaxID=84139 RepID=UPI0016ADF8BE|nr:protein phosphatase 2C domain-containing protein [Gordonia sp. (in: high G+C Gram-positive bacteria)]NLG47755.1 serine/threonine protein phosphatase [Gordonia sp. (in: high G+C Gram-positive bacteria)]